MDEQEQREREEQAISAAERRFRLILFSGAAVATLLVLGVCGALAAVAPYVAFYDREPTRIEVTITGTVERIAGMPMPADAVVTGQTYRETGGTFDYTTHHRPAQIFDFYYFIVSQNGGWRTGSRPLVSDDSATFRFYPGVLPRLTIVNVSCGPDLCRVHVEY